MGVIPAALGLLIPIAVVVGIVVAATIGDTTDINSVSTGDCVATRDGAAIDMSGAELVKVGCSHPSAQAKVVARFDNTNDTFKWRQNSDSNDTYAGSDDTKYYVLCLRAFN